MKINLKVGLHNFIARKYIFGAGDSKEKSLTLKNACISHGANFPSSLQQEDSPRTCVAGGLIVISMKHAFLTTDKELCNMRPIIDSLVEEGKLEIVEDRTVESYYFGHSGHIFVLHKSSP